MSSHFHGMASKGAIPLTQKLRVRAQLPGNNHKVTRSLHHNPVAKKNPILGRRQGPHVIKSSGLKKPKGLLTNAHVGGV